MQEKNALDSTKDSTKDVSFEDRVEKVKNIVNMLSNNSLSLKDGMKLYEEGMEELKEAQLMLEEAQVIFDEIKNNKFSVKKNDD